MYAIVIVYLPALLCFEKIAGVGPAIAVLSCTGQSGGRRDVGCWTGHFRLGKTPMNGGFELGKSLVLLVHFP